jgi:hypothetical protein
VLCSTKDETEASDGSSSTRGAVTLRPVVLLSGAGVGGVCSRLYLLRAHEEAVRPTSAPHSCPLTCTHTSISTVINISDR